MADKADGPSRRPSITHQEALQFHSRGRPGKLEIVPTKPMATQRDLSLAYSPGVAVPVKAIAADPSTAYDYTTRGNLVAVISNGTAILGLGNLGALASRAPRSAARDRGQAGSSRRRSLAHPLARPHNPGRRHRDHRNADRRGSRGHCDRIRRSGAAAGARTAPYRDSRRRRCGEVLKMLKNQSAQQRPAAFGAAHGERTPVSWAKISVADFGGTGVSDCAVGNTARDTSGSNPSLSTRKSARAASVSP